MTNDVMMLRVLSQRLSEPCNRSAIARQIWQDNPKLNWRRQYVGRLSFFFLQLGARNILIAELGKQWWRPGAAARAP